MEIQNFTVIGLHGKSNYQIKLVDNTLILVAENGSGKTTIVSMFYYFLSRQWSKLNEYKFDTLTLTINGRDFSFDKKNFKDLFIRDSKINRRFPTRYITIAEKILNLYSIEELISSPDLLEHVAIMNGIPISAVRDIITFYKDEGQRIDKDNNVRDLENYLNEAFENTQIVYLPTYRRIEKDLKNIFPYLEENMKDYELRRRRKYPISEVPEYLELVEFGMEDVKERIARRCVELKGLFYNNLSYKITGSYLEDILNKTYKSFDSAKVQNFNDQALRYLMKRLDDSVISQQGKEGLKKFVEKVKAEGAISDEDKINAYFVSKLFQIYEEQQKEEVDINKFVEICNDYIKSGKEFKYDNDNFKVDIFLDEIISTHSYYKEDGKYFVKEKKEKATIDWKDLSSGEKQIVSLFSHLILNKKKYFVIIDEPELSLSVPWQERFLPDIKESGGCVGLLAVTHSPFIFRNSLINYSHSLEEFKSN
jgi:hypothetical protein